MKQIPVTDAELKHSFIDSNNWNLNLLTMRCAEHDSGVGRTIKGAVNDAGNKDIEVLLEVCCDKFFYSIIERQKQIIESMGNMKELSDFHEQRAANSEISETILVGGEEVLEVDIKDLWHSSDEGDYLELTGNRQLPVPPEEVQRVRDFLEHRNDVLGIHRKLNISGQDVFDNEISELLYRTEIPFVKLTDGRLIEIKTIEVDAIEHLVNRNKKLRGEDL